MDAIQPFLAVLLVLGLLSGALYFLRNRGAVALHLPRLTSAGPKRMEVLERVSLGSQHTLHLVRIGGRSMVVATGAGAGQSSCRILCDVPVEAPPRP